MCHTLLALVISRPTNHMLDKVSRVASVLFDWYLDDRDM